MPGADHQLLGDFLLPYEEVARTDDSDATLLAFLEATYATGSRLADWDGADERAPATVRG